MDSVHEKSVRHGHISTLHIWPARRPLAASRAVLLTSLLSDPGSPEDRRKLLARISGRVVEVADSDGRLREQTEGGVLRWGREQGQQLEELRAEVRNAYNGQAPRVLDPFAGGGAIPLEAMRLGCEVVAKDLNPVAWLILRCTLHYPRLVTAKRRLPLFAVKNHNFMAKFLNAQGIKKPASVDHVIASLGGIHQGSSQMSIAGIDVPVDTDQAPFDWHLRAWSTNLLEAVRRKLSNRYPTYAEFQPINKRAKVERHSGQRYTHREPRIVKPDKNGQLTAAFLNSEFDSTYLSDVDNPRWVMKPTVAYLWARTSRCANCRAEIPLLKTCWLCKRGKKRVLLKIVPQNDRQSVVYQLQLNVPIGAGNATQRREYDKRIDTGTMNRNGATCPCCSAIATIKDLRARGQAGLLGRRLIAVVVNGPAGKEYRLPRLEEVDAADVKQEEIDELYSHIPFGLPNEPTPKAGKGAARAFSVDGYGFDVWSKLFTNRQLLTIGTFVQELRELKSLMHDYPDNWCEAIVAYGAICLDRLIDYSSAICMWHNGRETMSHTFTRFALPMVWDYAECNPFSNSTGNFSSAVEWVSRFVAHAIKIDGAAPAPIVSVESAIQTSGRYDVIVTDPPYYDSIPYSDLMDFFYVWLRRIFVGIVPEIEEKFRNRLGPKWDSEKCDGELIDDASRFGGDSLASRNNYEDGMARAFSRFNKSLRDGGRLVIVFANKQPEAWETLVSALIRAGLVVTGSWPIQTEMQNRPRSLTSAALSSSIWLVCRKRPPTALLGWDAPVLAEMQTNINRRTHEFWDAGIRGPDFIWAATGPALEAFSRHPVVKKANSPGQRLTVTEFLRRVRRMVVSFIVSRLLHGDSASEELDDVTTYYLLHRRDFGLSPAPAGACILYALSCNLSDSRLTGRADLLHRAGHVNSTGDDESEASSGSFGSDLRLKVWSRRVGRDLGESSASGHAPPLIDCVHRLMILWKAGERSVVDSYLDARGLWESEIFARVIQAIIELADRNSDERSMLETIQNHIQGHRAIHRTIQHSLL